MLDRHDNLRQLGPIELGLGDDRLSDLVIQVFDDILSKLNLLWINDGDVTGAGMASLPTFRNLGYLGLHWYTSLTDISPFPVMTSLTKLDLYHTSISDLTPFQNMYDAGAFSEAPF